MNDNKSFEKNDIVIAFHPLKRNTKKRENYRATVVSKNSDGMHYDVELAALPGKTIKNVHKDNIFKPGTERTLEIYRGLLFVCIFIYLFFFLVFREFAIHAFDLFRNVACFIDSQGKHLSYAWIELVSFERANKKKSLAKILIKKKYGKK